MKKFYYFLKVSMERTIKEMIRYKFNTVSDILSFYALFIAMFLGLRGFGAGMGVSSIKLGNTLEGFVAGYFLWTIMVMAYSDISYSVINDASRGTLEQLNMSSIALPHILVMRSISNLMINIIISIIILFSIMATTNYWVNINIIPIILFIFIGIFSILGISLMFGGLALIFKKIQSFLNLIQYFLIGLVIPGVKDGNIVTSAILPFRPTIEKIYMTMLKGYSINDFTLKDYGLMIGNSVVYFCIGLLVFNQCIRIAKSRGLLGQY